MPTYTYECSSCGTQVEEFKPVAERNNTPPHCGNEMRLVIACKTVHADLEPYFDNQLDTYIKSRQHKKSVMREKDVADKRDYRGERWRNKRNYPRESM